MNNTGGYRIDSLSSDLTQLVETKITTKAELAVWYRMADSVLQRLRISTLDELGPVPEFVWHYLSDADIRHKDAEYEKLQNRMIRRLIDYLNQGVMPSADLLSE